MKKLLDYNKFNFLKENYADFNPYSQTGIEPNALGPGYGFAVDTSISVFGGQDSPYTDQYYRTPMMVNRLLDLIKTFNKDSSGSYGQIKYDQFLEDVEEITDLKILRINKNENLTLDIYISFFFGEDEFFGVYKKFNWVQKPTLRTDFFTDSRFSYIDSQYMLKFDQFIYKTLVNWFRPKNGDYQNLSNNVILRNQMGESVLVPKGAIVTVTGNNKDKDGNPYIEIKWKGYKYILNKNDYYFFKYWFEKIPEGEKKLY